MTDTRTPSPRLLYLASALPALSETFVWRELLGLRARGWTVHAASVHAPQRDLAAAELRALADEALPIYGAGTAALLLAATAELVTRPLYTLRTLLLAATDVLRATDAPWLRRLKGPWQALAGVALARRARPLGIAHIHAHMAHVPTSIAMYAARQLGVPFSFTGHANDLFQQRSLLRVKLRRAHFVACISHWHRALYRSIAALPDERLPVVRCGVATPPLPASRPAPARPRILAVGRLVPKKGFDVLVRAMGQLVASGRAVSCDIIGGGPQRGELATLVAALGLAEHINLLGPRDHADVQAALTMADLFVLPCRVDPSGDRDGIPVVLMEAMAAGVPVVSGDLPAIRELIRDGHTGRLVAGGDAHALAGVLAELLDSRTQRERLRREGYAWVADEFSFDVNLVRLEVALRHGAAGDRPALPVRPAGSSATAASRPI
jgi:colanic acid/amylovoran biosynthesis glycosyltransferase